MNPVRKRSNTWLQASALFAACVVLVLASVGDLRHGASLQAAASFDLRMPQVEGGHEWLQVANSQDGSVRMYDARDGRLLSIAAASSK
ncbi:hypothetical protein [Dyella agri]|uniref:WD40 repeat domain-containing protein n=1 Tax=Dyella agri TaxID=1926869 RepID=A0ABW8KBJ6_9GAMM